ncbi:MAG: hypothetical protein ABW039_07945 [Sphingobium sp.]
MAVYLPSLLVAAIVAGPAAAAASAPQDALQVASKIFIEQRSLGADGTVRVEPTAAKRAVPGDHVIFVLAYRNGGAQPLKDIVLNNPVPSAVAYRTGGVSAVTPELSIDGKSFGALDQLRVPLAGGGSRAATATDVRHVRWRIATIPAGGQGQVAFKAILK